MKDFRLNHMLMITALMLTLAAMLSGPASARVVDVDGTTGSTPAASTPTFDDKADLYKGDTTVQSGRTVIPYLSHGQGLGNKQSTEPEPFIPRLSHGLGLGDSQSAQSVTQQVIPYLSHGIGVDSSQYTGQQSSEPQQVIPYLSHGIGVDSSQYTGQQSNQPKTVVPYLSQGQGVDASQYAGQSPTRSSSDDGFEWGSVKIGAGAALAALLLAVMTTIGRRSKGGRPTATS